MQTSFLITDPRLHLLLQNVTEQGATQAARGFSGMLGKTLTVAVPQVQLVPLPAVPTLLGGPESETVGIYLRAQGKITWQIVLIVSHAQALELVNMILDNPPNALATTLGRLELSALGELGNLTGTFFLNAVANFTGLDLRPSPPAVMVDMLGAVLEVLVTSYHGLEHTQDVLMLQAAFLTEAREVQANFWVIPDPEALHVFAQKGFVL